MHGNLLAIGDVLPVHDAVERPQLLLSTASPAESIHEEPPSTDPELLTPSPGPDLTEQALQPSLDETALNQSPLIDIRSSEPEGLSQQQLQQQVLKAEPAGEGASQDAPVQDETWHLQQGDEDEEGADGSTPDQRDTLAMQQAQAGNQRQQGQAEHANAIQMPSMH